MAASKYALVSHHYWGSPGGGQLVCASAAFSLDSIGYTPIITGTFKFDKSKYVDWYGIDISKYNTVTLPLGNIKAFGLWTRLYVWYPASRAISKYRPDLMFIDEETYGPLVKYRSRGLKIVEYIHFPFEVVVDPKFRGSGLAYGEDPYIMERYGRFPLNVYWWVFRKMLPRYLRRNPFTDSDLVLTNSKWTAEVAKLVYGERPMVLNPPIAPNTEVLSKPRPFEERSDMVVMLGRFSEEKRYHWVVSEVAPMLVKEHEGARLVIFGGATTRTQISYLNRVIELARRSGLKVSDSLDKAADLYVIPNAPRPLINATMDRAKAFLHATINEHWGIAVAEAMARGLPTVVHRSGGTWSDLVNEGEHGLGYIDAHEAVDALVTLLTDGRRWTTYSSASVNRVGELTLWRFRDNLIALLKARGIV